jgi:hypothetical protein
MFASLIATLFNIYKWVIRLLTGTCELQRICSSSKEHNIQMTHQFEHSFNQSKQLASLRRTIEATRKYPQKLSVLKHSEHSDVEYVVDEILRIKGYTAKQRELKNKYWIENMTKCVQQMIRVNRAVQYLTELKQLSVNRDIEHHDSMLNEFWNRLLPDITRSEPVTHEWQMLGFQGHDPLTDFRGMGALGLINLHYFASEHANHAQILLRESKSESDDVGDLRWYGFAISGINFTAELYNMASRYHVLFRRRFYTCASDQDVLRVFNEMYVKLFIEFHNHWKKENATVMQFNEKKDEVVKKFFDLI